MASFINTCIVSLTPQGKKLAQLLLHDFYSQMGSVEHLHCPQPFSVVVQERFNNKSRMLFICSTGIVVRTLAPLLVSKHDDPPVLVVDENSRFVIPLLSGHEGGANQWASEVANQLGAQVVITSAQTYLDNVMVVGMGCEKDCPLDQLQHLFYSILKQNNIDVLTINAIASIDVKQNEPALVALAGELNIPLRCYSAEMLRTVENRLSTLSDIVFKAVGCYGVAEAAALVHAERITGQPAQLIVTKQKNAHATIAVAQVQIESINN